MSRFHDSDKFLISSLPIFWAGLNYYYRVTFVPQHEISRGVLAILNIESGYVWISQA